MSELRCNIVLYRPDPDLLATRFRYWNPEALLSQADALITRCLEDFKEYSALDYAWNHFQTDLEAQEKKLGLFSQPLAEAVAAPEEVEEKSEDAQEAPEEEHAEPAAEPGEAEQPAGILEPAGLRSSLDVRAEAVQRRRELAAPGQPFALDEQRDLVLKRLCRDYEEAVNRACVAEEGLKKLHGHLDVASPHPSEAETLGTSITSLSIWIRNSSEWLAEYRQKEQSFTRAVSVRGLMSRNAWALLKHSRESYSVKLQIPADLFRGHENCHLRGIGASLIGEAGTVPWTIILRLPAEAAYERSGQSVEVDQSARATCLLGRVENRRSVRPVEFCATTSWLNASPIGRSTQEGLWSLDLLKPAGVSSETFAHVEDVVLEIKAVGIPQKITS